MVPRLPGLAPPAPVLSGPPPAAASAWGPSSSNNKWQGQWHTMNNDNSQASKVFLRGWGNFDDKELTGLSSTDAVNLATKVLQKVSPETRGKVRQILAPYGKNTQVTLTVAGGTEECWSLRNELTQKLLMSPVDVAGKTVYMTVENPPWKVERNQQLTKARLALRRVLSAQAFAKLDFKYSECAVLSSTGSDGCYLGRLTRRGWRWFDAELTREFPEVPLDRLKRDGAFSDED